MENATDLKPFNHPMHIANTIAKRRRELLLTLNAIEQCGAKGGEKRKLVIQAYEIFELAMGEIDNRIRATEGH